MSTNHSPDSSDSTQTPLERAVDQQLAEPYIIHLLFRSFRNLQAIIQEPLAAKGHPGIGLAETRLLLAIDKEGTRINHLAERTGTSRQFTSRVVHNLEELGYIRIVPDPKDNRAARVIIEERGQQYFRDMKAVKSSLDATLSRAMGEERMAMLVSTLQDLIQYTDQREQGTDAE